MKTKAQLFKTAIARTSTPCCKSGEYVALEWYCFSGGKNWYLINGTQCCLPETQLERFCL